MNKVMIKVYVSHQSQIRKDWNKNNLTNYKIIDRSLVLIVEKS